MTHNTPSTPPTTLSDKAYKALKQIASIWLPALTTLYVTLDGIFGLPAEDKVVATVAAINVFLGVVLAAYSRSYDKSDAKFDGDISTNGTDLYNMQLNQPVAPTTANGELRLKVNTEPPV